MTTERVATLEDLQGAYSDVFKDVYGFRPRGSVIWNDEEALKGELTYLYAELERVIEREKGEQAIAVADFEQRVTETIALGAGTRENAIRWIAQGIDDADPDGVCYSLGLPFGYLGQTYLFERESA
jgi:hypothetical protein